MPSPEITLILLILGILAMAFMSRASKRETRAPKHAPRPSTTSPPRPNSALHPRHDGKEIKGRAWVIDGDTIIIRKTKIRLAGIDAPELDQPWGQKAKWEMVHICKGQTITARLNGEVSYDRLVATCHLPDGTDIGGEIVRRGLAIDLPHFSGGRYRHLEPPEARRKLNGLGFTQRPRPRV